jgi:outer membrane protein TolC
MSNARLLEEHATLNTSQLIKDIELRYNQLIQELNHLEQMQELLKNVLEQTNQNLEMAQQRYRLGLTTQLDLDRANRDNLEANIDFEMNQYQIVLKMLNIDHLLSNDLQTINK